MKTSKRKPKKDLAQSLSLQKYIKKKLECNWQIKLLGLVDNLEGKTKNKIETDESSQNHATERDFFVFEKDKAKKR